MYLSECDTGASTGFRFPVRVVELADVRLCEAVDAAERPLSRLQNSQKLAFPLNLCSGAHSSSLKLLRSKRERMSMTGTLLATTLATTLIVTTTLHAQSPALTNADIARLVAMHVSDQTVIAVIHEAKLRQFDLNELAVAHLANSGVSAAVLAAMRQPLPPLPTNETAARGERTLAEAAAEAAKIAHSWELSTNIGASSPAVLPTRLSTAESTQSAGTATTTTVVKDEAWWRSHAIELQRKLTADITKLAAMRAYYDGQPEEARAKQEIASLAAVVVNDRRALSDFEDEARRAGVPPGWLREK